MESSNKRIILIMILFCHFISSFTVLGMEPFFGEILDKSFQMKSSFWTGIFYATPALMMALASPVWGKLASRIGRKISLLRAQLGLALGFMLAGMATTAEVFFFALVLQGTLGGSFAASNALLADLMDGKQLAQAMSYLQGATRLALITAPVLTGLFVPVDSPAILYRYFMFLPVIAVILLIFIKLPAGSISQNTKTVLSGLTRITEKIQRAPATYPLPVLLFMQFIFTFVISLTLPYFIPFIGSDFDGISAAQATILLSIPNLVYLLANYHVVRHIKTHSYFKVFTVSLFIYGIIQLLQVMAHSLNVFIILRLMTGVAMTLGLVCLSGLFSQLPAKKVCSSYFGWMDSFSNWAVCLTGIIAGVTVKLYDLNAPFIIVGLISLGSALILWIWQLSVTKQVLKKVEPGI